jgi:hypothetical protein
MGDPSRVGAAVRQVQKAKKGSVAKLRKRVEIHDRAAGSD